jgi:CRP-like cAMP-binding protein
MAEIALNQIALFAQLPAEALAELERLLQPRTLAAGEVLFNQGDPGSELIIVQEGQLAIYAPEPGEPAKGQPIRVFTSGGMLGEMALVDQQPRSLSARAETAATILALRREDFQRLVAENPKMSAALMGGLSERIRYTTDFLGEVRQWVQRITEGNYQAGMPIEDSGKYKDPTLATLAAEFSAMAAQVKQREDTLKQEVAMLRIEIDEKRRKEEASQIMDSEYYRSLKEKVRSMRQKKE